MFKFEDNHIVNQNFFINAKYAFFNWGYGFEPRGGMDLDNGIDLVNNVAYGSSSRYRSFRPWHVANIDGNYFKNANGGSHEFKFGFGYRRNPTTSTTTFAGSSVVAKQNDINAAGQGIGYALVYRNRIAKFRGENLSAYVGDSFTKGRLTVNAGIRWDRQTAQNLDSDTPANPLFPELVPAVSIRANDLTSIKWKNFSPRISGSLALDDSRKTVVRASYARYAGQLNNLDVLNNNAVGAYYPYLAYNWVDLNGDHFAQRNEVLVGDGVAYNNVIDPANPAGSSTPNQVDPNYKANVDHEFIVGIDKELAPNFAVNFAYTWRRGNNITAWNPRVGLTVDDYTANDPVTINGFTAQTFSPNPDLVAQFGGGRTVTNRPDFHRGYNGLELSLIKRLSNKWMARAAFSYMNWKEYIDGPNAAQNPTPTEPRYGIGIGGLSGPLVDGGASAIRSYGDKGDVYFNAKWQVNASALYQLPAGFEIAGNVYGRQGYPFVTILRIPAPGESGTYRALATGKVDDIRQDNLWTTDIRLAKTLKLGPTVNLGLTVDVFNIFNANTVLQRTRDAASDDYRTILEVLSPRVARIGVRLGF